MVAKPNGEIAKERRNTCPRKKKIIGQIELQIQAGPANPAPPVGPALGQHGVNIMEFCKAYNAATEYQRGNVIPAEITVYEDRSFTFNLKTPPAAKLLLKAAGVQRGLGEPHKTKVAKVTWDQVREIAETKKEDLNANDVDKPRPRSSPAPPGRWASRSNSRRRIDSDNRGRIFRFNSVEGQLRPGQPQLPLIRRYE